MQKVARSGKKWQKGENTIKEIKTALILDTQNSKMLLPVTIW